MKTLSTLLDVVIVALALWVVTAFVPGIRIESDDGNPVAVFLGVAVVFMLVNAVLKPILSLFGAPITLLTLGLFALVINAIVLLAAAWFSQKMGLGLYVDSFWSALVGAVVLAVARWLIDVVVK